MRKGVVFAVIAMLVLLTACGGNKIQAKPLSARTPTAAVPVEQTPSPTPASEQAPKMTAAQAIKELQEQMANTPAISSTGPKTATTGMPPAPQGLTGKDALLARTRALYSTSSEVPDNMLTGGVIRDLPRLNDE
ncbi:MAG: hypothetical protein QXR48_02490 [Candidatus Woesearchaeota archaeon]